MPLIRVNPESIHQYARGAQQQFDAIRLELQGLVDDAVNVRYFGPNAVTFKMRCGEMASTFGHQMAQDLARIADAVRVSTTNVAGSLGGSPISISVNGAPVPLPQVPAGDGSVEVETSGLEALKPLVARRIDSVIAQLDAHLRALQNTDWQGQAKESAVSAVSGFTSTAKTRASEAQRSITAFVDGQIDDVLAKDR